MRALIILFLVGMLGAAAWALILIRKIAAVYARVWGSDVSLGAWRRKRWAFTFMLAAQILGVVSLFTDWGQEASLGYVLLMFISLCLFCDSYRLLLDDLKLLPRKEVRGPQ